MEVFVLAVTKAYDKYCIAGLDEYGRWVRPIPNSHSTRFWERNELIFNKGFIRAGDVIEIQGHAPAHYQFKNHTEDFIVDDNRLTWVKRLNNEQLLFFIRQKEESEKSFKNTVNANSRSLCLIKVDEFYAQITQFRDEPAKPKMFFSNKAFNVTNPKTNTGNYIVKDCKISNLIMNQKLEESQLYNEVYLTIGLATPTGFNGVEYPQIIGLHTNPLIPFPINYPD